MASLNDVQITIPKDSQVPEKEYFDYSKRAQWLRAAVLGATDGLVSVASLMMGVGAVKHGIAVMILTGFAGLVAGACSMAIGEFISVYSQLDIEVAQIKRNKRNEKHDEESEKDQLPNPFQAALASALAFSLGALVPLVAAAFIREHKMRLIVVTAAVTFSLVVFGAVGAVLGKTPAVKSCARLLIGGWIAMAITFSLTKLIASHGL
ncbi:vacuolar iron transporter-like [Heracleum sosnowskyi]|uniref:Vacuolar iron transporter n=1 Tax=Heracleum sosnowskyi TaxID=360622 RepID=A0AAD8JGV7_9APIA|nr:vacuolar iron transporter-like [Heracleum sosnowskyi]